MILDKMRGRRWKKTWLCRQTFGTTGHHFVSEQCMICESSGLWGQINVCCSRANTSVPKNEDDEFEKLCNRNPFHIARHYQLVHLFPRLPALSATLPCLVRLTIFDRAVKEFVSCVKLVPACFSSPCLRLQWHTSSFRTRRFDK